LGVQFQFSSPLVLSHPFQQFKGKTMQNPFQLLQIPRNAALCHYAETQKGYAVVTPSGKVLAPSFYALRNTHEFYCSINGVGGWVVLVPRPSLNSQEPAIQKSLF
jgi:hypothetical protein